MITVITINLNNILGLKKTIESVLTQKDIDVEYIVIDGASNDGSVELINSYKHKINYCVSETDNGIFNAMNKGIKKSKGEFLIFLNSGDAFYSEKSLYNLSSSCEGFDLIFGDLLVVSNKSAFRKYYPDSLTFDFFFNWQSLPHPATLIHRSLFEKVGLYREDLKISSDGDFFLKALVNESASYFHYNEIITVFDGNGISGDKKFRHILEFERDIILRQFPFFKLDYELFESVRKKVVYFESSFLHKIVSRIEKSKLWSTIRRAKKNRTYICLFNKK